VASVLDNTGLMKCMFMKEWFEKNSFLLTEKKTKKKTVNIWKLANILLPHHSLQFYQYDE
jgi:hypothetical protein